MSFRSHLNRMLARWGLVFERSMPAVLQSQSRLTACFDQLLRAEIYRNGGRFHFVQIGGNDGVTRADDLISYVREFDSSGIVVEPQPDIFDNLKTNFAKYDDIVLLNKAVHREKRRMTLYRFNQSALEGRNDLPIWARTNGIASFDRQHVLDHAHKLGLGGDSTEEVEVECITPDELIAQCDALPVLLKIDVEGYDFEILDAIDFEQFRPPIVRFENLHMAGDQYRAIIDKLSSHGYRFIANRMDTTACASSNPLR